MATIWPPAEADRVDRLTPLKRYTGGASHRRARHPTQDRLSVGALLQTVAGRSALAGKAPGQAVRRQTRIDFQPTLFERRFADPQAGQSGVGKPAVSH